MLSVLIITVVVLCTIAWAKVQLYYNCYKMHFIECLHKADVMMELEGIDLMFSDQDFKPMPVKEYREYMNERKKEAKAKDNHRK